MSGAVFIVGYGAGVHAATAQAFTAAGHSVALLARGAAKVEADAAELGNGARGFAADASDEASLRRSLDAARAALGEPAAVVYNAAFRRPGPVLGLTAAALEADYRTDAVGAFVAAQWAAPAMRARRGGSLLFTGGGLALRPSPIAPTLSIGKAAIRVLALMLAEELAGDGVCVGTVTIAGTVGDGPGQVSTTRVAEAFMALHAGPAAGRGGGRRARLGTGGRSAGGIDVRAAASALDRLSIHPAHRRCRRR